MALLVSCLHGCATARAQCTTKQTFSQCTSFLEGTLIKIFIELIITKNWLYAYHSLLEAPLDLEALGLNLHSLLVNPALGITRLDGARGNTQVWCPMFESEVFRKQINSIEESTCSTVGTFRRPLQSVGAAIVIQTPGNCARLVPLHTPQQTARKWQSSVWVWCLRLVVLGLSNHADPYFLVWWSLTARKKCLFQDSKKLKLN